MASLKALLPALDLGLLLVLVTFGTAGLTRLTARQPAGPSEAPATSAAVSLESLARRIAELSNDREKLQQDLAAARVKADELQRQLAQAQVPEVDLPGLRKQRQAIRGRIDNLRREIARAEELLSELQKRKSEYAAQQTRVQGLRGELADLADEIKKAEGKNKELANRLRAQQQQLEETTPKPIPVDTTPLAKLATNRTPVYVALVRGTVAPLGEPHFRREHEMVELGNGRFETHIKCVPRTSGEPVDDAVKDGSSFHQLLARVDTNRRYIVLLVDSNSFEAYWKVRVSLCKRGVSFGWEPWQGGTVRITPTGQMIPPQG